MRSGHQTEERVVFRLDFALRGHGAYAQPLSLSELIELVERAQQRLGAPLLRHLEHLVEHGGDD